MAIRRAQIRDIEDVLRLLVQVNMVHHNARPDLFRGPATKYSAEELAEIFSDDARPVFVMTDIRTLYIDDLCVDEKMRGKHIGRSLYEYVLHFARENGCYNVTLNVWVCNPDAMRFYEKCGLHQQKIGMEVIL